MAADPEAVSVVAPEVVSASVETQVCVAALETGSVSVDPKIVSVVAFEVGSASVEREVSAAETETGAAIVDPKVVSVAAEPEAVFVDIAFVFVVLVPASVVVAGADSSGLPKFFVFPNVDLFASSSSSVEVAGEESVRSPIGAHASYGLCSIFSS